MIHTARERAGGTVAEAARAVAAGGSGKPELGETLRSALRWWLDELRACVPNALKARRGAPPAAFVCLVFADGRLAVAPLDRTRPTLPSEEDAAEPSEAVRARIEASVRDHAPGRGGRGVRLCVPAALCLVRRTRIPARALSHAGALLRHEVEGLIPLPPEEILSDWYVETEDFEARALDLVQVVLARPRIAAAQALLAGAGLTVTQITVGEADGRAMPVDLIGGRDPSLRAYLARLPKTAKLMLALAAALFAATPFLVSVGQDAALETLSQMRGAALRPSPAAQSAQAVADALEGLASAPRASRLLDGIAARLPAGTHLERFALDEGQIVLSLGGGEDAASRAALAGVEGVSGVDPVEEQPGLLVLRLGAAPMPGPAPVLGLGLGLGLGGAVPGGAGETGAAP